MICFPNAKINLGLHITGKLADGYHSIETIFYPVAWCDMLEVLENKNYSKGDAKFNLYETGFTTNVNVEKNLCYKAYHLLDEKFSLPPVCVYLHKIIPMGAGLGGGSADAAFILTSLNKLFKLNCSDETLAQLAATLGADCAFFIRNKPSLAQNKGEVLSNIEVSLKGNYIVIIKPSIHISTADAYRKVKPKQPSKSLQQIISSPAQNWRNELKNDFEEFLFPDFPQLATIKKLLYDSGAWYASMSGSGSAVYGLFKEEEMIKDIEIRIRGIRVESIFTVCL